jgi:hypothetical protein
MGVPQVGPTPSLGNRKAISSAGVPLAALLVLPTLQI